MKARIEQHITPHVRRHTVVVPIKHEKLAPAEDTVMQYLENNDMITDRMAAET